VSAAAGQAKEKPGRSIGTNLVFPSSQVVHIDPESVSADGDLSWSVGVG
jgi:hypothetical protein